MILKEPIILFLAIFILSLIMVQSSNCNRSCGDKLVPYPFGFSTGCQIPLNCSSNTHQQLIAGFPILNINTNRIKISIEATFNRPLQALHRLYGRNYAPTSRNAILLQNCSSPAPCMIPSTMVYTHFEALACSPNSSNVSCYSENKANGFVDYNKVIKSNSKSFLSSISAESFNESGVLEVLVVELGWWIEGRCSELCSEKQFVMKLFHHLIDGQDSVADAETGSLVMDIEPAMVAGNVSFLYFVAASKLCN